MLTLAGITAVSYLPYVNRQHDADAYNTTLTALRRTRDQAAADMRIYVVTFTNPGTITVAQTTISSCQIPAAGNVIFTATLPTDETFMVEPGAPTSNTTAPTTPDAFGTGAFAIDIDETNNPGTTSVCFNPDGTATDAAGNLSNGVIYIGRVNDVYSARAVTLWGATGRVRGWRLYNVSGVNTWSQQ